MTARSIRRAAERQAAKLARKAEKAAVHSVGIQLDSEPEAPATYTVCPAQLQANRANAQLSTGPTSLDGKATSCLNAVKTGLTGRTVLLHTDDAAEYQHHIAEFEKELSPVGPRERDLVQSIADTLWRLRRIPALEFAIYAQGHVEFAGDFNEYDAALRPGMIDLKSFMTYEKQLRNLQLQESRLSRRREREMAELRDLQQARQKKEQEALDAAARLYAIARKAQKSFDPQENGFEFSIAKIERYLDGISSAGIDKMTPERGRQVAIAHLKTNTQAA